MNKMENCPLCGSKMVQVEEYWDCSNSTLARYIDEEFSEPHYYLMSPGITSRSEQVALLPVGHMTLNDNGKTRIFLPDENGDILVKYKGQMGNSMTADFVDLVSNREEFEEFMKNLDIMS